MQLELKAGSLTNYKVEKIGRVFFSDRLVEVIARYQQIVAFYPRERKGYRWLFKVLGPSIEARGTPLSGNRELDTL